MSPDAVAAPAAEPDVIASAAPMPAADAEPDEEPVCALVAVSAPLVVAAPDALPLWSDDADSTPLVVATPAAEPDDEPPTASMEPDALATPAALPLCALVADSVPDVVAAPVALPVVVLTSVPHQSTATSTASEDAARFDDARPIGAFAFRVTRNVVICWRSRFGLRACRCS